MEEKKCAVRHFCDSSCAEIVNSVPKRVSEASRAEQKWALQGSERRSRKLKERRGEERGLCAQLKSQSPHLIPSHFIP